MAARDEVISFCDQLLEINSFGDYGPNGLQVPGSAEVGRVASAVSAHLESIEAAIEEGRRVYDNLIKSIVFILPTSAGESLLVLLAPNKVALLSHELGNDVLANVAIWTVGLPSRWPASTRR